jgi:hypothetical protein
MSSRRVWPLIVGGNGGEQRKLVAGIRRRAQPGFDARSAMAFITALRMPGS